MIISWLSETSTLYMDMDLGILPDTEFRLYLTLYLCH